VDLLDPQDCQTCTSDPLKNCVATDQAKNQEPCYQCQFKPDACALLGFLTKDQCERCEQGQTCSEVSGTVAGLTCYRCQTKGSSCENLGMVTEEGCRSCPICHRAQIEAQGQPCYDCYLHPGTGACLDEDYYQDCSRCRSDQRCLKMGLILFSGDEKSPVMDCYVCE
jgi:hypothetical protein